MKRYRAAVFDMDGTILDTITDLTSSLNEACRKTGHRANFTKDDVRHFFGSGAEVAAQRALAVEKGYTLREVGALGVNRRAADFGVSEETANAVIAAFAAHYAVHCDDATGPYPGILALLRRLKTAGVQIAVVSNKLDEAVQVLHRVARNSGMDCISVSWGFRSREALEALGATHIVDRAEEIFDMIVGN